MLNKFFLYLAITLICFNQAHPKCVGRFVNPITDICWSCLFPITIGGIRVSSNGEDTLNPKGLFCTCTTPFPRVGFPVSFWEPVRLVDVTRTPYCLVNMGGVSLMKQGVKGQGGVEGQTDAPLRNSFYHAHWYIYPLIYWLELLTDFICLEKSGFDVAYITEIDPLWNDDETGFILNPEAVLFGNPIAQAACAADCATVSTGFSHDYLFWCAGCQGSLYPFSGTVSSHVGGVQASLLVLQKMIAKYIPLIVFVENIPFSLRGIFVDVFKEIKKGDKEFVHVNNTLDLEIDQAIRKVIIQNSSIKNSVYQEWNTRCTTCSM